jgi:hypothetical protein
MSPRSRNLTHTDRADHETRDQEVLRATRELAAYFKGKRTEREARAALKIIKAFVRNREHTDPADRRPLPGSQPASVSKDRNRKKPRLLQHDRPTTESVS